jgi:hypothetical protein
MNFIEIPNIPEKEAVLVLTDGRISHAAEISLNKLGITVIKTQKYEGLYDAISMHPDIMLHPAGGNVIIYAPGIDLSILKILSHYGFVLIKGSKNLCSQYPEDIAYNAVRVGKRVIHNFRYTDSIIKSFYEQQGLDFINVNQGYAKCSISVVDENSIITADKGIARAAEKAGIEVLLIDCDEHIKLPGVDKGFIGGATGLISPKLWVINGNLENLKSSRQIIEFLEKRGIRPISLTEEDVMDIGSIIPLLTK